MYYKSSNLIPDVLKGRTLEHLVTLVLRNLGQIVYYRFPVRGMLIYKSAQILLRSSYS